jgi:hypothetical protein
MGDVRAMKFDWLDSDAGERLAGADKEAPAAAQDARRMLAKWLYWSRGVRPELGEGLFGEPGWDLLLDLYIREKSGSRSSVTSACIGSRAPHTTALRYVTAMVEAGWLERTADPSDKRRHWLSLSETGLKKLDRYFDRLLLTLGQSPLGIL